MTDWRKLLEKWFIENKEDGSDVMVAPPGNSPERIAEVEAEINARFPDQMREFYSQVDGFDLLGSVDEVPEFVKRIDAIPGYMNQERSYLTDTYPEFAKVYLPFIDFGNGDSAGYVYVSEDRDREPVLVMVEHEKFRYDSDQPIDEFVTELSPDLEEFFT